MSLSKTLSALLLVLVSNVCIAQELFVYTEPASNMPAKSFGIRLTDYINEGYSEGYTANTPFIPELMWGVSKNLMIHAEMFLGNNAATPFEVNGGALYAKYRFYSADQVYRHFRMAVYGRAAVNKGHVHMDALQINGQNTGYQLGWVGTQLLHKTALSLNLYYEQAIDNLNNNRFPETVGNKAINYSFSAGRLILPKKYTGYKQMNLNLMLEILGQHSLADSRQYLSAAPSVQFIFNSQTRIDIGYRYDLYNNTNTATNNGFIVRLEHLLFNLF